MYCHKVSRYSFSGHESFQCKSLWLKKGYDFLQADYNFADADAVTKLGVGKNMVSSIRFWLRAFGLTANDKLQPIASIIYDGTLGGDPFEEDIMTLWLLHFMLVSSNIASIYRLLFISYQRERKEFTKGSIQSFIQRKCSSQGQIKTYNENTVRKDIGVLMKNYVTPEDLRTIDDFSSLLIPLGLISNTGKFDNNGEPLYGFKTTQIDDIAPEIILYALLKMRGNDYTISFDVLHDIALIFCLEITTLIDIIRHIEKSFPGMLVFSDNSGIKNVQILRNIEETSVLNHYYRRQS